MKLLKNNTAQAVPISDMGVVVPASGQHLIHPNEFPLWATSANTVSLLQAGTLTLNDGYDDLKLTNALRHLQEEGMPRPSSFIATAAVIAVSNSTLTLDASSRLLTIFTGTTAGQILKLGDARTYNIGHAYEVWNTSNQSIVIQNNADGAIFLLAAQQKTWIKLQGNTTQAGTWLIEANFLGGTGGGGNATLGFGFDGNASTGRWLESLTNVSTIYTQPTIAGPKVIRAMSFTVSSSSTITATVFKNGSALDTISLSSQIRTSKLNLYHVLLDLDYISAQITSGSASRPVLLLWL